MIATTPSMSQIVRLAFMAVLCIGFSAWGAYDLWVKIPRREQIAQRYEQASARLKELEELRQKHQQNKTLPTAAEVEAYNAANAELKAITPGGEAPVHPTKFDKAFQWVYIACLPFAYWPLVSLLRIRRQRYRLEEDGSLHFEGDPEHRAGTWTAAQIADIDMSRWMAKSVATVVNAAGPRLKLDAYMHKNLDLIIGAIAHRLHPAQWDADARPVKGEQGDAAKSASTGEAA